MSLRVLRCPPRGLARLQSGKAGPAAGTGMNAARLGSAGHPVIGAARCRTFPGRILKILDVLADRYIRRGQTKLLPRSRLIRELQKRVLVQHLLDFLAQLQRRELQQTNRLLQLRRQRQMLRNAKRQPLFHAAPKPLHPPSTRRGTGLAGPQVSAPGGGRTLHAVSVKGGSQAAPRNRLSRAAGAAPGGGRELHEVSDKGGEPHGYILKCSPR